tara:strand:- start:273679 stop:274083 length:405 start_codon:yes stop_codon:yes gene_type:complete
MVVHQGVAHPDMCDVMGHMTTRHYVAMFDDASYHFLFKAFGWTGDQAISERIGWADVQHLIEYAEEVAAGDLLEISAKLEKIGRKSITVTYSMFNLSRSMLAATLQSTSVYFDLDARKAILITDAMRERASPLL